MTLSGAKPHQVESSLLSEFPESLVTVNQIKSHMKAVRKTDMNGLSEMDYFIQLVKGGTEHAVIDVDLGENELRNRMKAKVIQSQDWVLAWEQNDSTACVIRMCLFHSDGNVIRSNLIY